MDAAAVLDTRSQLAGTNYQTPGMDTLVRKKMHWGEADEAARSVCVWVENPVRDESE